MPPKKPAKKRTRAPMQKQTMTADHTNLQRVNLTLSDLCLQIAGEESAKLGMKRSQWVEWVVLSQVFPAAEAAALAAERPKVGKRASQQVVVLPDDAVLPEEG